MSVYVPDSHHLRQALIFFFHLKKSAAEAHQILSDTYGKAAINETTCREYFQRFENGDFDIEDQHSGGREVFKEIKVGALVKEDSCPSQKESARSLRETRRAIAKRRKDMGMIQKQGKSK